MGTDRLRQLLPFLILGFSQAFVYILHESMLQRLIYNTNVQTYSQSGPVTAIFTTVQFSSLVSNFRQRSFAHKIYLDEASTGSVA